MLGPNVIVITTHDSGRCFGCYGDPCVHSPNIDGLAADGIRCTQMFATAPICSPSRGSLMTGQYPQRNGLMGLVGLCWNWQMTDPNRHLSHLLREAGYATAMFGLQDEEGPREGLGFDRYEAYMPARHGSEQYGAEAVAERVAEYLRERRHQDRPFYAQVGLFETHTPYDYCGTEADEEAGVWVPSWADIDLEDPGRRAHVAGLQGSVRRADAAVGMILDALAHSGMEQDTLVLFNTDHGPELPRGKWTLLDGGLGIAFILRWPGGGLQGGDPCPALLSNVDWVPTLFDLLDLPAPGHTVDGISFAPALRGRQSEAEQRHTLGAFFINAQTWCVRTEKFKLIRDFNEGVVAPGVRVEKPDDLLFDLTEDPDERHDVAGDPKYAPALADMDARFWTWLETVDDPLLRGPVATPRYQRLMRRYQDYRGADHG